MDCRSCLRQVVENIFNNWTALQLAVEHSMGGPLSKQTALEFLEHFTEYCGNTPDIEKEDIEDYLEDFMDQEFNTICEDDSIKEIAFVINKFITILKNGDSVQFEAEYKNLPSTKHWLSSASSLSTSTHVEESVPVQKETEESTSSANEMVVEDPGWTQVRTKRKK